MRGREGLYTGKVCVRLAIDLFSTGSISPLDHQPQPTSYVIFQK